MKEILISLSQNNRHNKFLKNNIELRCMCGYLDKITYYDFLSGGEFIIGEPVSKISPFISDAIYEETITITPLHVLKKCPVCDRDIMAMFPVSFENIIAILQTPPPDPHMYG